ncbi:hypothetical protein pb186bvf_003232 [Paramecium bursaria]
MSIYYNGQNKYQYIKDLGKGGYGKVVQAKQCDSHQEVAIKIMSLEKHKEYGGIVGKLVMNEVQALSRIKEQLNNNQTICSNVVDFIEYFKDDTNSYLVLQYCNGGTLEDFLNDQSNYIVDDRTFKKFLFQLLNGMYQLHSCQIIHRDLKTENILIHNKQLIIADLGFCDMYDNETTVFNLNLGTIGYKAPEIILGMPYGIQADMFSMGVVLFEMCLGQKPFRQSTDLKIFLREASNNIHIQKLDDSTIDDDLKETLKKMLMYNANDRITWQELYKTNLIKKSSIVVPNNFLEIQDNIQQTYQIIQQKQSNNNQENPQLNNQFQIPQYQHTQPNQQTSSVVYQSIMEQTMKIQNLYSRISTIQINDLDVVNQLQKIDQHFQQMFQNDIQLKLNYLFPRVLIMKKIYESTQIIIEEFTFLSQDDEQNQDNELFKKYKQIFDSFLDIKQIVFDSYAQLMGNRKQIQLSMNQLEELREPFEKSSKYKQNFLNSLTEFSKKLDQKSQQLVQFVIRIFKNPHFNDAFRSQINDIVQN